MADSESKSKGKPPKGDLEINLKRLGKLTLSESTTIKLTKGKANATGGEIHLVCHNCGITMHITIPPHLDFNLLRIGCPRCEYI